MAHEMVRCEDYIFGLLLLESKMTCCFELIVGQEHEGCCLWMKTVSIRILK